MQRQCVIVNKQICWVDLALNPALQLGRVILSLYPRLKSEYINILTLEDYCDDTKIPMPMLDSWQLLNKYQFLLFLEICLIVLNIGLGETK